MWLGSLIVWAACAGNPPVITPGVYVDPTREETIRVTDSMAEFHIRVRSGSWLSREYEISVHDDGYIQPHALTSSDGFLGVGSYDWWWNGTSIVRENYKTGEKVEFSRETAP